MARKASQFPLKLDPQPNDFVVGLDSANPSKFIRIAIATLPTQENQGIDLSSLQTVETISNQDFVIGIISETPTVLVKIPTSLLVSSTGGIAVYANSSLLSASPAGLNLTGDGVNISIDGNEIISLNIFGVNYSTDTISGTTANLNFLGSNVAVLNSETGSLDISIPSQDVINEINNRLAIIETALGL